MRSFWAATASFVAGLVIVALRPMFLADDMSTSVYDSSAGWLTWFGWILLIAGAVMLVVSFMRSRRRKRP